MTALDDDPDAGDSSNNADSSLLTAARQFAHYSTVGIMFPVAIALGFFGGYFLDRWLSTTPLFAFVGLAMGFTAALRNLLRTVASDEDD